MMFMVFEGVMNPQFSPYLICIFSKKHHFHFSGSLTLCEKTSCLTQQIKGHFLVVIQIPFISL